MTNRRLFLFSLISFVLAASVSRAHEGHGPEGLGADSLGHVLLPEHGGIALAAALFVGAAWAWKSRGRRRKAARE